MKIGVMQAKMTPPKGSTGSDVTRGNTSAPARGKPGSTYEKVDEKGDVKNRTKYGANGKPETREDYDHTHYDKETGRTLKNHKHHYKYNENEQPLKNEEKVTPLP